MRSALLLFLCAGAFAAAPARVLETAPIRFEPVPQRGSEVQWTARGLGYAFSFDNRGAEMRLADRSVRVAFDGANSSAHMEGAGRNAAPTNYFIGTQRAAVPSFRRLRRSGIYPGIDVVYYGNGRNLEYDLEIAAGADPSRIALRFDGADAIRLNERGEIVLALGDGELTQRAPSVYQKRPSGEIVSVDAAYRIDANGTVRVALGNYDPAELLVIDPTMVYQAYLTGSLTDAAIAVTHDAQGNIYLGGYTYSTDFPLSSSGNAYENTNQGGRDVWVMEINPAASSPDQVIVYSSYFGGGADDTLKALAVDANGLIYFTGSTNSGALPVSSGAYQATISGKTHAFLAVLDPTQGTSGLVYSSYLGGTTSEEGDGIAVANGLAYITGWTTSSDFPAVGAYQPAQKSGYEAFVSVFDITKSGAASLVYSTYLGGSAQDVGRAIAADAAGFIYVTGYTYSSDFPTTADAYRMGYTGSGDAFLAKLDPGAGTLVYSTFLGGSGTDEAKKLIVEPNGHRVAIAGYTTSPDFPVTQNAFQSLFGAAMNPDGATNAFLTILDLTAQPGDALAYSTYFGGYGGEVAYDLKRDPKGRYYLSGYTMSHNLPVTTGNAISAVSAGPGMDGFVAVIDPSLPPSSALVFSTYITSAGIQVVYGVDVDANGVIYITGITTSNIFPGQTYASTVGKQDAFIWAFIP